MFCYRVARPSVLSAREQVRCYSLRKRVFFSVVMGCGHARRCSVSPETEESALSWPLTPCDAILTNHGFFDTMLV
jgi:hypothetical protein